MPRRAETDPLLLQAVSQRLARLLAETPASGVDDAEPGDRTGAASDPAPHPAPARAAVEDVLLDVEEVPPPRHFGRRHLGVVCVLLLAALVVGGWSLLRARPVAIAAPVLPSAVSAAPSPVASDRSSSTPAAGGSSAATPATAPPTVVVHVLGAVRRPGLVTLPGRVRVQDAVDAAGGFTRDADPGELNLAQVLQDGEQVVIGTRKQPAGEVRGGSAVGAGGGGSGSGSTAGGGAAVLDLNAATEAQLEELPGVGPVTAGKILAWREAHSRFSRVEELQEVDGIGPKTYAQIAPHVRV